MYTHMCVYTHIYIHTLENFLMSLRQRNNIRKLGPFMITTEVSKMTPKFAQN